MIWEFKLNKRVADALYKESVICELWTLGFLLNRSNVSRGSMYYIHQSDLFRSHDSKQSESELDIICVVDGKFILGEAKYFSYSFDDKCIDKQIRNVLETQVLHRNVGNYKVFGKLLSLLFGGNLFICITSKYGYSKKDAKTGSKFLFGEKKYYSVYDTTQLY